jgi:hypothetical protein
MMAFKASPFGAPCWQRPRKPPIAGLMVTTAVASELFTGYTIRDNPRLNMVMLLWPLDTIQDWQEGR